MNTTHPLTHSPSGLTDDTDSVPTGPGLLTAGLTPSAVGTPSAGPSIKSQLMKIISSTMAQPGALDFKAPVTDALAPRYSRIVPHPMCLNKLQREVSGGKRTSLHSLGEGVKLIAYNANLYNMQSTPFPAEANKLATYALTAICQAENPGLDAASAAAQVKDELEDVLSAAREKRLHWIKTGWLPPDEADEAEVALAGTEPDEEFRALLQEEANAYAAAQAAAAQAAAAAAAPTAAETPSTDADSTATPKPKAGQKRKAANAAEGDKRKPRARRR